MKFFGTICAGLCLLMSGTVAYASSMGSILAQEKFNERVFELLQQNDLEQLQAYLDSVPNCVNPPEGEPMPEFCTNDRMDGLDYIRHVWRKGWRTNVMEFNVVAMDVGIYDALGKLYWTRYRASRTQFDERHYRDFHDRYKDTWLAPRVEQTLTQLWQRGTTYEKYNGFSAMTGKDIYTTLYVSFRSGFGNIYKYVSRDIRLDKYLRGGGRGRLQTILKEMEQASAETDSPWLLRNIKTHWLYSILSPESRDEEEKEYYQGIKQRRMYEMLNEEGWAMFADLSETLHKTQKHNIGVYIQACPHLYSQEICDGFEQGAIKYGFYIPPIKYEEPTPEEMLKEIQTQLQEKLQGI